MLHATGQCRTMVTSLTFCVAVCLTLTFAQANTSAKQPTLTFVDDGVLQAVKVIGKAWETKDGALECQGSGKNADRLVSPQSIGPGDFCIKARLSITGLNKSAASFRMGFKNRAVFGFEGSHGSMYVAGTFFGSDPTSGKIADPAEFTQEGKPFDLEINRQGDQLLILIDGKLVRQQTVTIGSVGPVGFVPIRSTMRIEKFSATANFTPFQLTVSPKYINEVERISLHPLVEEMPDLKLGPFVRLPDGGLLTAEEKSSFVSYDNGKTWKEYRIFTEDEPFQIKPERVIMRLNSGTLLLVMNNWAVEKIHWNHKTNKPFPDMHRPTYLLRSFDDGKTWSKPQLLYGGYNGSLRDAIQLKDDTVVIMGQELIYEEGRNSSRAYVSTDDGVNWTKAHLLDVGSEKGDHSGTIEGTLVQLNDGRIWTLLRTYHGWFYEAFSEDNGLNWTPRPPAKSKIRSTGSPGMIKRLADGRLILIWNAIPNKGFVRREELSVAFSSDEGKTWTPPLVIAKNPSGRVSYPYMFESKPGVLWITTMQGNFRGSMKVDDLYREAISKEPLPEFRKSTKHYKEYSSLPVSDFSVSNEK